MKTLNPTPGWITVAEMEPKPWRDRIRDEDALLQQLNGLVTDAANRRAEALLEGVDDLGTIAEVARDRGLSWNAVDKAIKKYERRKAASPGGTTTK